jgi:hypothetical protein
VTVFWITFVRNKIETCGLRRSTAKANRHLFTSKNFSGLQFRSRLCKGSLEKQAGFPKTCMAAYWFFYIFGISIKNWVYSYMFRTFSWHFFFVEGLCPGVTSINKISQNAVFFAQSFAILCSSNILQFLKLLSSVQVTFWLILFIDVTLGQRPSTKKKCQEKVRNIYE